MPTPQILNRQARQVDLRLQTLNTSSLYEVRAKLLALKRDLKADYHRVKQEINTVAIDIREVDTMKNTVTTELSSRGVVGSSIPLATSAPAGTAAPTGEAAFQSPLTSILEHPHSRRKSSSGYMTNVPTPTFVFGPDEPFSSPISPYHQQQHNPSQTHFDPLSSVAPATSSSVSCEDQEVVAAAAASSSAGRFHNSNYMESGGNGASSATTNYTPESNRTLRTVLSRILSTVTQQSPADSFRNGGGDQTLQNSFHQYVSSGGAGGPSENLSRDNGSSVSLLTLNTTSVSDRSNGTASTPTGRQRDTATLVKVLPQCEQ